MVLKKSKLACSWDGGARVEALDDSIRWRPHYTAGRPTVPFCVLRLPAQTLRLSSGCGGRGPHSACPAARSRDVRHGRLLGPERREWDAASAGDQGLVVEQDRGGSGADNGQDIPDSRYPESQGQPASTGWMPALRGLGSPNCVF